MQCHIYVFVQSET